MAWLAKIPTWVLAGVAGLLLAFILCNIIGRPKNGPNVYADTLAATRKAYAADTDRLIKSNDSLKLYADSQQALKEVERQKWIEAEQRGAVARVNAANARAGLRNARTVRDSLVAALIVIAAQDTVIASLTTALESAHNAFGRLTQEHAATLERADSLDAGWRRTRDRLGLAEAALAVEVRRTSCSVNLIVTHVKCPSRTATFVVGAVGALVADRLLRNKAGS